MVCAKCLDDKDPDDFYTNFSKCKKCIREIRKEHYRQNSDLIKSRIKNYQVQNSEKVIGWKQKWQKDNFKKYRQENREKERSWNLKYRENNKDIVNERISKSRKKNRGLYNYHSASYKKKIKQATPKWLVKELLDDIKIFYIISRELTKQTGIEYHVDHIDPIVGKIGNVHVSCGLNVAWNLQIITKKENLIKRSKIVYKNRSNI